MIIFIFYFHTYHLCFNISNRAQFLTLLFTFAIAFKRFIQ